MPTNSGAERVSEERVEDALLREIVSTHSTAGVLYKMARELIQLRAELARLRESVEWKPITDGNLPEVGVRVLLWHYMWSGWIVGYRNSGDNEWYEWLNNYNGAQVFPTHWRPSPSPPSALHSPQTPAKEQ